MTHAELFDLIYEALAPIEMDQSTEHGKRVYLAYLAARVGQGVDGTLERRMTTLRTEIGI